MTLEIRCGMSNKKQQVWSGSFSPAKATVIKSDEVSVVCYSDCKLDKILRYIFGGDTVELGFLKDNPIFAYIKTDDDIIPATLLLSLEERNVVATL